MSEASNEAREFWNIEISKMKESGFSLPEYSKQSGIAAHKLLYWRNKLQGRVYYKKKRASFSEVKIPIASSFKIFLPNGIVIEANTVLDSSLIKQLV